MCVRVCVSVVVVRGVAGSGCLLHGDGGVGPRREGVQVEEEAAPAVDGQRDADDAHHVHHYARLGLGEGRSSC